MRRRDGECAGLQGRAAAGLELGAAGATGRPAPTDADCVAFLQWCLPRLGLRWPGFRKVRRQVCKRIRRRLHLLGIADLPAYRRLLEETPAEWAELDLLCRVTISRFCRDRAVFSALAADILPERAARAAGTIAYWSAGCASGEEAYSLRLAWDFAVAAQFPAARLCIVGTDVDPALLARARRACYPAGALRELPGAWRRAAFAERADGFCLKPAYRARVAFRQQDIRKRMPSGAFALILCRNLAFTYFAPALQERVLVRLAARLEPGGTLVLGSHETLPKSAAQLGLTLAAPALWRKE